MFCLLCTFCSSMIAVTITLSPTQLLENFCITPYLDNSKEMTVLLGLPVKLLLLFTLMRSANFHAPPLFAFG